MESFVNQVISYIKIIMNSLIPILKNAWTFILPILLAIFTYVTNVNYYDIISSKPFIIIILTGLLLFFTYAYLKFNNPVLLKKIMDFLFLKPQPAKFKFETNVDLTVESRN